MKDLRIWFVASMLVIISACGSHSSALVPSTSPGAINPESITSTRITANRFAAASNNILTDQDIDTYIDPSVTGQNRVLARKLMAMMPVRMRSDFIYRDNQGNLLSNNPALLASVKISHKTSQSTLAPSAIRSIKSYTSSCSPPDPANPAGGPYLRDVSACGFTMGWGFVNVACNTTSLLPSEEGQLYFELRDANGGLTEGGLQYNNDSSVQPYLRASAHGLPNENNNTGYITMINAGVHYACGQTLLIAHGATYDGSMTATVTGQLPSNLDPSVEWIDPAAFIPLNEAYLFEQAAPGAFSGPGLDKANYPTPCSISCSVSRVTSIAQGGVISYSMDGHYFGAGQTNNFIHWSDINFGEWGANCFANTQFCTHSYAQGANARGTYGEQNYPDINTATSLHSTNGMYETYDGIALYPRNAHTVQPASVMKAPLPPAIVSNPCNTNGGVTGPGGLIWKSFTQPQGSIGCYIQDPSGMYLYYGSDGIIYRDNHSGQVYPSEVATNYIGNISSFDFRSIFWGFQLVTAPSNISGPSGLSWTSFTQSQGSTGHFIPILQSSGGGYLYFGPDGILYRLNHTGQVYQNEINSTKVGTVSSYNFKAIYPFLN